MSLYIHVAAIHRVNDTRIYLRQAYRLNILGFDTLVIHNHPDSSSQEKPSCHASSIYHFTRLPKARFFFGLKLVFFLISSRPNVIHFHEPDLLVWLPLMRLVFSRTVFIYDVHEDLQSQILDSKKIPFILKPLFIYGSIFFEILAVSLCHVIAVATPQILKKKHFRLSNNLCLLPNYPLEARCEILCEPKRFRLTYIGGISIIRGIMSILDAIVLDSSIKLTLAGPIEEGLIVQLQEHPAWKQVEYYGVIAYEVAMKLMAESYCSLLLFNKAANTVDSLPNKIFEYLSMGAPVVCSDFTGWKSIVSCKELGIPVDPFDSKEVLSAIQYYRSQADVIHYSKYRSEYVKINFTFDSYHDNLLKVIETFLAK